MKLIFLSQQTFIEHLLNATHIVCHELMSNVPIYCIPSLTKHLKYKEERKRVGDWEKDTGMEEGGREKRGREKLNNIN